MAVIAGPAHYSGRPMSTVWAVVVTYNRRDLLEECLAELAGQTRPLDHVLVVDNASSDGTAEMVRQKHPGLGLLALAENVGGAGGFNRGMEVAYAGGADWIWLMDDDTIPTPDALAELLAAPDELPSSLPRPLLLASKAVWTDGSLHPMNHPGFERNHPELLIQGCERGLMPLRTSTFVSLLVHRDAVEHHGLPLAHYFIWSDDIEYTARVTRAGGGAYLVPTSVVQHKTKTAYTAVSTSGTRFYYHVRNYVYMIRGSAWDAREKLTLVWLLSRTSLQYLRYNSFAKVNMTVILRGLRDGLLTPAK